MHKIKLIVLRFGIIYGNKNINLCAVEAIFKSLMKDSSSISVGSLSSARRFIHVDDICDAILKVLNSDVIGVMDVGTGDSNSLVDIVKHVGLKNVEHRVGDENERLDNKADIKSLMSIGWKPKIKLYDYLDRNYG